MQGGIMKRISKNYMHATLFAIIACFTVMIFGGPAFAGDHMMQSNLNEIADQMDRWSKQCSTTELTPDAQAKLSELLAETSRLLKEMSGKSDAAMHAEHSTKIQTMKKAWDPFDTSGRM